MPCPFFTPVEPWLENTLEPWPGPRRVPLGEPYRGNCSLTDDLIEAHDQATICNFGYARGRCSHFPDSANDAIRFSISSSTGGQIQLIWIAERNHAPMAHGTATYRQDLFDPALPCEVVPLALAFVHTYLRGKSPQGFCR